MTIGQNMQLNIDRLIAYFGGVNALAEALKQQDPQNAASTAAIYKWRTRGSLPLAETETLKQWTGTRDDVVHYTLEGQVDKHGQTRLSGNVRAVLHTECQRCLEPMALERMSRPRVAKKPICATTAISAISSATPHKPSRARNGMVFSWVKIRAKLYLA